MDLVYLNNSGEGILVLSTDLSILAECIFGLLGFIIFNSNLGLVEGLEIRVMGKDHLFSKVRQ